MTAIRAQPDFEKHMNRCERNKTCLGRRAAQRVEFKTRPEHQRRHWKAPSPPAPGLVPIRQPGHWVALQMLLPQIALTRFVAKPRAQPAGCPVSPLFFGRFQEDPRQKNGAQREPKPG